MGGGINDFVTIVLKPLYKKRDDGGRGVKNYQKLRDVIYGRPLFCFNVCDGKLYI